MKTNIHFQSYLAQFFLEKKNIFHTNVVETTATHILRSITFSSRKSCRLWDWERGKPQTTIWRIRIACWIPKATNTHTHTHTHTHRLYYTHCFSTATMVARTRLNVTLYVHCLSCYLSLALRILTSRCVKLYRLKQHFSNLTFMGPCNAILL